LNTHIDIVHIHEGKKRFECTDCDSRLAWLKLWRVRPNKVQGVDRCSMMNYRPYF
jgi:hypothetical protein